MNLHPDIAAVLAGERRWAVVTADCLSILPTIPAGSVGGICVDPPYGIGDRMQGGTWGAAEKYADFRAWDVAPSRETFDAILALGGVVICWGGNYFTLPPSRCWLVWDKCNAVPTMADAELAWTNLDRPTKRYSGPVGIHTNGHPTEKPLSLMRWCMGFMPPDCVVLDSYMGVGSTGVACMMTGRRFIGIEIEGRYADIARRRIADAANTLWTPEPRQEQLELRP